MVKLVVLAAPKLIAPVVPPPAVPESMVIAPELPVVASPDFRVTAPVFEVAPAVLPDRSVRATELVEPAV